MAEWPSYACKRATVRMTIADLKELLQDVPAELRRDGDTLSKERMVTALNAATTAFLEANYASRARPTRKEFDGLTASECNEWLASLPPMPLAGEADNA